MGCELSKLSSSSMQNRGRDSPPPPAATDPRLPLTAKQRYTVIASWRAVSRAMEATGIYMFVKRTPSFSKCSRSFKISKLRSNRLRVWSSRKHAIKVMKTLDEGIKGLDDMDVFLTYLHEVGASHTKIPSFNRQYFWRKRTDAKTDAELQKMQMQIHNLTKVINDFMAQKRVEKDSGIVYGNG
ncbi:hypothetical protein ABMA27_017040 [Loxostege sticticalis]|uniref:Globin domain-containing protein n=1 Tax=Loxostege sticticalis TaxID=481309 RepID=A0ABR3GYB9_LOXSC